MSTKLISPDTMTLLDKSSPLGSDDNSASLAEARGVHSRASSTRSHSTRTGDSTSRPGTREKRSESGGSTTLPGPVPRGQALRNVVYYQNRFIVIDSTPAPSSSSSTLPRLPPPSLSSNHHHHHSARALTSVSQPQGGVAHHHQQQRTRASSATQLTGSKSDTTTTDYAGSSSLANLRMAAAAPASDKTPRGPPRAAVEPAQRARISALDGRVGYCHQQQQQQQLPPRSTTTTANNNNNSSSSNTRRSAADMDAQRDGRGIEIIVSDETGVSHRPDKPRLSGKRALLKRIGTILLDNRMKGKENCEHLLTEHPEEYRVLKKVLNIIFVTVGVALLVSVFVVIVYTHVVGENESSPEKSTQPVKIQSHNTTTETPKNATHVPQGA